jgi:DNA repair protein RecN (Recombination protein N)
MLETLSINNIVLIDKLNLSFKEGLCVLTGETGSGKSILLDALGLALGYRSSSRLLRNGENKGGVVATFNIKSNQKAKDYLREMDISFDDAIIIRRILYDDGHSKAFINDTEITQKFLQSLGETLLEIHGQNEQIGLLNSQIHRDILDNYGSLLNIRRKVTDIFVRFKDVKEHLEELITKRDEINKEKDYLEHIINEIDSLNIQENEEEELSEKRRNMMNKEKILNVLKDVKAVLDGQFNISKNLCSAQHILSRASALGEDITESGKNAFIDIVNFLEDSNTNLNEANYLIEKVYNNIGFDGSTLEQVEERLFAIRGLARKLNTQPTYLNNLLKELQLKLDKLNMREVNLSNLQNELSELKNIFLKESTELSKLRKETAKKLAKELMLELSPLKMEKTVFDIEFKELSEEYWNRYGIDSIRFVASTNPGMPLDELSKIASGGELSRFMLALKVVLSQVQSVPTLIFDEIDTGIGGAVANAVGERLKKLSRSLQVLTVTHHAQIASKGDYHLKVSKEQQIDTTNTIIEILNGENRIKEIARMINGEIITDDVLNVAKEMLNN